MSNVTTSLLVNDEPVELTVRPNKLLVQALREDLGLTGTNIGCESGVCGSCTVLVDGDPVKSCTMLAAQAEDAEVRTVEGLADHGTLHPVQRSFQEEHGLQCGYCTPGMMMTAVALVTRNPDPSREEIREGLEGNLCRCTGYQNIVNAVESTADKLSEASD